MPMHHMFIKTTYNAYIYTAFKYFTCSTNVSIDYVHAMKYLFLCMNYIFFLYVFNTYRDYYHAVHLHKITTSTLHILSISIL